MLFGGKRFGAALLALGLWLASAPTQADEPSERIVEVRGGVLSFEFRGIHPHDLSQVLDQRNVCVRAGHHCAKPLMRVLGVNATARASLYLYNDRSDVDALADALDGATDIFGF